MFIFFISFSLFFLTSSSSSSSPLSSPIPQSKSQLNPSVLIVLVVITLIFSITFLLLLYLRYHSRNHTNHSFNFNNTVNNGATNGSRKNSGIDRMVIESLPVFQFGSLKGQKQGLECAVCLNVFEKLEYLKLLPKCNHAFHVNCVDTWLDAHSTCPLCRYKVYPEDILLSARLAAASGFEDVETGNIRRVSGRHSSAEVKGRSTTIQNIWHLNRISLDSSKKRIDRETRRKDGLLATAEEGRRFSHKIVVSSADGKDEVSENEDLYYLRSEMIISGSRRFSGV